MLKIKTALKLVTVFGLAIFMALCFAPLSAYAAQREYEPTIFMRRLPRGNIFSQGHTITRDRFLRTYGNPNLFYFEGRMYTSEVFFDTYNGQGFRWEITTNNPQGVRAHDVTLIPGHVAAPRLVRGGNTGTSTPAAPVPDVSFNNQPETNNNLPYTHERPESEWQEGDAVLFDRLTLLSDQELLDLVERAVSAEDTRSDIILTRQRLTESELAAWVVEYSALGGINAFELEVIRLINIERASHNLGSLSILPHYMMAARLRSQSMVDAGYFAHQSPVYGGRGAFISLFGANLGSSEALSIGHATPDSVVAGWMNSPGHRQILLSETIGAVGIGRVGGITTAFFVGSWALESL